MKKFKISKKLLIIISSVVVVAVLAFFAYSLFGKPDYYQLALDNLAEARFYMKFDESSKLKVQFFSGMREEPYEMNGVSEKTTAFAIINVEPKDNSLSDRLEITGTLKIGEELIPVTLEKNPYDKNFACDIARLVESDKELILVLDLGENEKPSFNLHNIMGENTINWEQALAVAVKHQEDKIKDAGKFECYIKIISKLDHNTQSYWYIQFIPENGKTFFCVIDPSGSVVG